MILFFQMKLGAHFLLFGSRTQDLKKEKGLSIREALFPYLEFTVVLGTQRCRIRPVEDAAVPDMEMSAGTADRFRRL